MKTLITLLIIVSICFVGNSQPKTTYVAHLFIDHKKAIDYYVSGNRINKLVYLGETKVPREEIYYIYDQSNKLRHVKFKGLEKGIRGDEQFEKKLLDDQAFQEQMLRDERINVPLQTLNPNELSDVAYVCSVGLKLMETHRGFYRYITIDNIFKKFRFYPSYLERFISIDNVVQRYTLTLKRDTLTKEVIVFDKGRLVRSYSWANANTLIIRIECNYRDGTTVSSIRKIQID